MIRAGISIWASVRRGAPTVAPNGDPLVGDTPADNAILQQDGFVFLRENGSGYILRESGGMPVFLAETGGMVTQENGNPFEVEG